MKSRIQSQLPGDIRYKYTFPSLYKIFNVVCTKTISINKSSKSIIWDWQSISSFRNLNKVNIFLKKTKITKKLQNDEKVTKKIKKIKPKKSIKNTTCGISLAIKKITMYHIIYSDSILRLFLYKRMHQSDLFMVG